MATFVRKLLDQVSDPSTKAAHSELCFKHARDAATKAAHIAPFAVSDTEAITLERLGITTSPFATTSHTHAADKILENDCLSLIGHYLPKSRVTFIQLKRSKLHLLKRGPDQDTLANYCHEPKDVLRYGITNPHSCPTVTTSHAVLADTLHFMSTKQLVTLFSHNPNLEKLFATLVLPIEALHKLPSLFPDIYKLEYYANHFAYMPGGHAGGAYVHSYATLKWLSTGQVGTHTNNILSTGQTDFITLEKIETKAAHHVMLIQRRRLRVSWPLPPIWVFQASDFVRLPHIFYPPEANVQNAYPDVLVKRLQAYCFSVKAVSLRDIFAKIRQVIETQDLRRYSMADLIRLANFLLFTAGMQQVSDYDSFLTKGWLARLSACMQAQIRKLTEGLLGHSSYSALLSVADVIPVHFTTKVVCRPAAGPEWFTDEEEPVPDEQLFQTSNQPSLQDLDLLAEFDERFGPHRGKEGAIVDQTLTPPGNIKCGNTERLTPPEAENKQPSGDSPLSGARVEFGTESTEVRAAQEAVDLSSVSRPPLLHPLLEANDRDIAAVEAALEAGPSGAKDHNGKPVEHEEPANLGEVQAGYDLGVAPDSDDDILSAELNEPPIPIPSPKDLSGLEPTAKSRTLVNESPGKGQAQETANLPKETQEILKLHGFTALKTQYSGDGPIQPVFFNPKANQLPKARPSEVGPTLRSLAASLHRSFYRYEIDNKRAVAYMSDVKNNLTGLVLPKLDRDRLSAWVSLAECSKREVSLLVVHGAGGAGKSRALQEVIRNHPSVAADINVIVPTVNLVLDWKKKLPAVDPKRFITFEKACEREGKPIALFDDYGKLPAGYIDAYLAIKPNVNTVILTGDQRQSTYHSSNRDAQSANLKPNVQFFSKWCDYYVNATHRQPRRLANPIGVHAEIQFGGSVQFKDLIPDTATVVVPSHRTQVALGDLGRKAFTYSGCQGLTLPEITIVLDNDTPLCSNEVLYTAFSRASHSITFVNTHSDNPAFLAKLDSTPYLKTLISGVREDEDAGRDEPPPEPEIREPLIKTHLPVCNTETFLEDRIEAVADKDVRELWAGDEKTNLMQTQDPIVQLFPHQQAKDEALFKITIDQRIRTASPKENAEELTSTLNAGDLLFEAYAEFMRVPKEPQPFDPDLWEHCKQAALRTYLSKPTSNLEQGKARQDPDFPANAIALFNKSQWVKKLDKVGFPFKAGQTISAFKQSTVLLTTTMALYLRRKRQNHQPHNIFIMCETAPSALNHFVTTRWDFSRPSYTSDYTQYDQSQDASFLNFELRKARHLGVPDEVLQFYKFVKLHAKTFVGNLAVMRLSGEGPTFDANTECNIAYDALRFQLDNTVNACYAGDDLVRDKVCAERPGWQYSQRLFKLQAKPLETTRPDFCGWRLTPHGIVKSPIQLYQSLMLAIRNNKMEEVKRSYAIDYAHAYKLGDKLEEIFDEREMDAHQLTTRIFTKKGLSLKGLGDHLPVFHVTSDRLIRNPHYKEMHDAISDRVLFAEINFDSNYVKTPDVGTA